MNRQYRVISILFVLFIYGLVPSWAVAQTAYNIRSNTWTTIQQFKAGFDIQYSKTLFDRFSVDSTGSLLIKATEKAPDALTAALAGAGAGNVDNGTHSYKVTFVTAGGETDAGAVSGTVTTTGGNGQVALSAIPTGSTFVTSRKVYRTAAGNAVTGPWLLLTTIADNNTTTYTDNTSDASLTTVIPSANTAIDKRAEWTNAGRFIIPTIIGGAGTTSTLTLQSTSGVGVSDAIIFNVGNNGATEAGRFNNQGLLTLAHGLTLSNGGLLIVGSIITSGSADLINIGGPKLRGVSGNLRLTSNLIIDAGDIATPASLLDLRAGDLTFSGANGQKYVQGRATELVAIGSGLTTKVTTIQIPADAIVYAVPVRVKTQPGGTSNFTVTATTSGTAFQKGVNISTTAGTTDPGTKNTPVNYNAVAAQTITFTFNSATTDALGEIRVDIYYTTSTPPTS